MKKALELVRAARQLLSEEQKRRPFLFSKLIQKTPPILPSKEALKPENAFAFSPLKTRKETPLLLPERFSVPAQVIETIPILKPLPFHSLRSVIERSCPNLKLKEEIPGDELAIQRKNAWKHRGFDVEVILIGYGKEKHQKTLLENMAKAIQVLGKRCQVIDALHLEQERGWDSFLKLPQLSFMIAPPLEVWQTPMLKSLIKAHPASGITTFGNAEILFMPTLEKILSDPTLKPRLWHTLCQKLVLQA